MFPGSRAMLKTIIVDTIALLSIDTIVFFDSLFCQIKILYCKHTSIILYRLSPFCLILGSGVYFV
jgi:hypothetical protein